MKLPSRDLILALVYYVSLALAGCVIGSAALAVMRGVCS